MDSSSVCDATDWLLRGRSATEDGVLPARILFALRGGRPRPLDVFVSCFGTGFGLVLLAACDGVDAGKGFDCWTGLSGSQAGLCTPLPEGRGVDDVDFMVHLVPEPVRRRVGGAVTGVRGGGIGVLAALCTGVGVASWLLRWAGIAGSGCCLTNGDAPRL